MFQDFSKNNISLKLIRNIAYLNINNKFLNYIFFNNVNFFSQFTLNHYLFNISIFNSFKNKFKILKQYKNFFFHYKIPLFFKFKYTKLFQNNIYKNKFKSPLFKNNLHSKTPSFNYNNYKILLRNWNYLIGLGSSPYNWDLSPRKKLFRKNINFLIIKNVNIFNKKNKLSKKIFKLDFIKKFYYNNFKYLFKIDFNYNQLNFMFKTKLSKKKIYHNDWFFSKIYLFLNNFESFKFNSTHPNFFLLNLFKVYFKIFNVFKRFNYSIRFKKFNQLTFKKSISKTLLIKKNKTHYIFNPSFQFFKNSLSFFSFKNISFPNSTKSFIKKKLLKKKSLNTWINLLILKNKFTKKSKFIKSFKPLLLKKYVRINWKIKKVNILNFIKISNLATFKWLKKSLPVSYQKLNQNKFHFFKPYTFLITSNKNFSFFNNSNLQKKKKKLKKRIFYFSKDKLNFLTPRNGFLFLNFFNINCLHSSSNFYNLKKSLFSFPYRNELRRYILKRYSKLNWSSFSFNNENQYLNYLSFKNTFLKNLNLMNNLKTNKSFYSSFIEHNFFKSPNWTSFNKNLDFVKNSEEEFVNLNIKRIRFKPGYMTLWRDARQSLQHSLCINFKYQYKLTNYISKFNKFIKFKTFLINELTLKNILIKSRFFSEPSLIDLFIKNNLVYLNGQINNNISAPTYIGDFIQLVINIKYYILYKWFLNLSLKKKNRLKRVIRAKAVNSSTSEEKKKSFSLPKWIIFSKNNIDDVSKFLEVDYFTLSTFIVYEPFLWSDLNIYNIIDNKFSIINIYNWKYIN